MAEKTVGADSEYESSQRRCRRSDFRGLRRYRCRYCTCRNAGCIRFNDVTVARGPPTSRPHYRAAQACCLRRRRRQPSRFRRVACCSACCHLAPTPEPATVTLTRVPPCTLVSRALAPAAPTLLPSSARMRSLVLLRSDAAMRTIALIGRLLSLRSNASRRQPPYARASASLRAASGRSRVARRSRRTRRLPRRSAVTRASRASGPSRSI